MDDGSESPRAAACKEGVGYLFDGERALFRILDKSVHLFVIENKNGRDSKPKFSRWRYEVVEFGNCDGGGGTKVIMRGQEDKETSWISMEAGHEPSESAR
ncbi:putative protein [Arabidopsis thaliana]|uniref:Uncharacterized protein F7M19_150 n=1 Tax=Arabidopsis thaliana TaxID=3702 RepID=Q9M247_ARATH|nr:putative protein [Arabidopsis thaliana]